MSGHRPRAARNGWARRAATVVLTLAVVGAMPLGCGGNDETDEGGGGSSKPAAAAPDVSIKKVRTCLEPQAKDVATELDHDFAAEGPVTEASTSFFVATFEPEADPAADENEEDPLEGQVLVLVADMKDADAAKKALASIEDDIQSETAEREAEGEILDRSDPGFTNNQVETKANLVVESSSAHDGVKRIVAGCLAGKTVKAESLTDPKVLLNCLRAAGGKRVRTIPEAEYEQGEGVYAITSQLDAAELAAESETALALTRTVAYAKFGGVGVVVLPQTSAQRAESFASLAGGEINQAKTAAGYDPDDPGLADNVASFEADLLFEFEASPESRAPAKVAGCAGEGA